MYGLNSASGFLDTEWVEKQGMVTPPEEVAKMLNPHLATMGKPVDVTSLMLPNGIFVPYTPTGPEPNIAIGGGYFYRPSYHGYGSVAEDSDDLQKLHKNVLCRKEGQWTRTALIGVPTTGNFPVDLFDYKNQKYQIVNTGPDALHSGDAFMVEPPSVEASKAQIDSFKRIRAQGSFRQPTLLGGLSATNRVPSELTHRMKHIMARDIGLCMDITTPGQGGVQAGLARLYQAPTELGQAVKNSVMATTLDCMNSLDVIFSMMRRIAALPRGVLETLAEFHNFKHGGPNATMPDPAILIEIWRTPAVADLFMESMDMGFQSIDRLRHCTYGTVIKSTEANPTSTRGEIIYNAYSGQYDTGDTFEGAVLSFNGY
ncbi:capsid triplex subunit 2 [Cyprinid herpesvirus 3]|nr:capsid triplex subunit 2 [Cyprinid herpesvirus 3]